MELCGYAFERVCDVEPDRTEGDAVEICVPQPAYDRRDERAVHDDGWGPFCSFDLPDEGTHRPGVYALAVEGDVVYVGETEDLYDQVADGYGRISPANCFEGGQRTNCRLNTEIFRAVRRGDTVSVHLHATDDFAGTEAENRALRRIIEDDLLAALDPAWNENGGDAEGASDDDETPSPDANRASPHTNEPAERSEPPRRASAAASPLTGGSNPEPSNHESPRTRTDDRSDTRESARPVDAPTGEFAELYDYLADHERDSVERTFAELEVVLDAPLPTEARRWQRWWTNDEASHPHSRTWLRAGYEVAEVSLPDGRVRFERRATDGPTPGDATADAAETFGGASPRRRE